MQASVCPVVHHGQIDFLSAFSNTSFQLCVGHLLIITITIMIIIIRRRISGSFCANTELHWDPFYLAENKRKHFFFSTTRGCFFPGAFAQNTHETCPLCALSHVAALAVFVAFAFAPNHAWASRKYRFASFTCHACICVGFNRTK